MPNKVKIIHIASSLGGVDTSIRGIMKHINDDRNESALIKGKEKCDDFISKSGKTIKTYEVSLTRAVNPVKDLMCLFSILKIIKKEKPKLIHTHSAKAGFIGRLAAYMLGVPVAYTPQAFSYLSANNRIKRRFFLFMERLAKNFNCTLLACSQSEAKRGINDVGFKDKKTKVWRNCIKPIDKSHFERLNASFKIPGPFICSIGRPSYQKNTELLIETFKIVSSRCQDINLVIMGVGHYSPDTGRINSLIKEYGLEQKTFLLDWVSRHDTLNLLSESLIYLSTSRYEGLPFAVLEAMALGKPCVLTDCDGNRDCIIDGVTGYLIENENAEDMSYKIVSLIEDNNQRFEFGENAKKYFDESFNIEINIDGLESIYSKMQNLE